MSRSAPRPMGEPPTPTVGMPPVWGRSRSHRLAASLRRETWTPKTSGPYSERMSRAARPWRAAKSASWPARMMRLSGWVPRYQAANQRENSVFPWRMLTARMSRPALLTQSRHACSISSRWRARFHWPRLRFSANAMGETSSGLGGGGSRRSAASAKGSGPAGRGLVAKGGGRAKALGPAISPRLPLVGDELVGEEVDGFDLAADGDGERGLGAGLVDVVVGDLAPLELDFGGLAFGGGFDRGVHGSHGVDHGCPLSVGGSALIPAGGVGHRWGMASPW